MKITFFDRIFFPASGLILYAGLAAQAQLPFKSLGESPANQPEQQELDSLFATVRTATASITPGGRTRASSGDRSQTN